jgi:hypothetical protein
MNRVMLAAVALALCTGWGCAKKYPGGVSKTLCEIRIYSMPQGARLFLNGHYVGRTPYKYTAINEGDSSAHFIVRDLAEIIARKQGYDDEVELVTVANCYKKLTIENEGVQEQVKSYRGTITLYLDEKEGMADVKHGNVMISVVPEEPDAEIYINDNLIGNGKTSLLKAPGGNYILKVRKPGYKPYVRVIGVIPENDITITAILERADEASVEGTAAKQAEKVELSPAGLEAEIEEDGVPGTVGGKD